jgi:hypothetical protein
MFCKLQSRFGQWQNATIRERSSPNNANHASDLSPAILNVFVYLEWPSTCDLLHQVLVGQPEQTGTSSRRLEVDPSRSGHQYILVQPQSTRG